MRNCFSLAYLEMFYFSLFFFFSFFSLMGKELMNVSQFFFASSIISAINLNTYFFNGKCWSSVIVEFSKFIWHVMGL